MGYTGRYKDDVPARSVEFAKTLNKYNGLAYFEVKKIEFATHWIPIEDKNKYLSISLNQMYRVYLDQYDNDYYVTNDLGLLSAIYLVHNGKFVILEDSQKWWNYVERLYVKEWQQTDKYRLMMKESMEAVRRAERED